MKSSTSILMKNLLFFFILFLSNVSLGQDINAFFDINSHTLRMNDKLKLKQFSIELQGNLKNKSIILTGYADTTGGAEHNLKLSKERVLEVRDFLVTNHVKEEYIKCQYFGDTKQTRKGAFFDRRVELRVQESNSVQTFEEFKNSIKPKVQKFIVNTQRESVIEGNQGTLIKIQANSFIDKEGNVVQGFVMVELQEFYTITDFFAGSLQTTSENELLESAGMINIEVSYNNERVDLKNGKSLDLNFPKVNEEDYEVFYGQLEEGIVKDWKKEKQLHLNLATNEKGELIISVSENESKNKFSVYDVKTGQIIEDSVKFTKAIEFQKELEKEAKRQKELYRDLEQGSEENIALQDKMDQDIQSYYHSIKSNKLGYINCDRFVNKLLAKSISLKCKSEESNLELLIASLIFEKRRSIINLNKNSRMFWIDMKIPFNEDLKVVCIAKNKATGELLMSVSKVKSHKEILLRADFKKTTSEEIQEALR